MRLGMDPRFLLGLVLGWKVLAEVGAGLGPERGPAAFSVACGCQGRLQGSQTALRQPPAYLPSLGLCPRC